MSRATRYNALISTYGFLPSEAKQLSHVSKSGLKAPYTGRLLRSRRALFMNAKRYNWSDKQYRNAIKEQYLSRGCIKQDILGRVRADVWQMVRWYEDRTPEADEYESPWRKKQQRRSIKKREAKVTSRRRWLTDLIAQLNTTIARTDITEARRARVTELRTRYQRQLEALQ